MSPFQHRHDDLSWIFLSSYCIFLTHFNIIVILYAFVPVSVSKWPILSPAEVVSIKVIFPRVVVTSS